MNTNDIFLKFQGNNNKLETVLSKKDFSVDVKNLLLSMLYKITSSYNDYANIKVNVENKNKFIDNIIEIISKCEEIEIINPSAEEAEEFRKHGITCKIDTYLKTIKVFPRERDMLFAIFKLNDTRMFLDEEYNIIRVALPEMLNEGRDINNIEIIRDFNAWSWNTLFSEISNIDCNLIYQNLLILLGFDFLDNWMKLENQKELIEKLEKKLKENYQDKYVDNLLDLIYRIAIIVCIKRNQGEKERLTDELEWDEKELAKLNNKEELVKELTAKKKEKAKEIVRIDKMINDKSLLEEEFERRNATLSEYKKIFSINVLLGTIKKERIKALEEIDECNNLLDAKNYVKRKDELTKNVDLLSEVRNIGRKEKHKIDLQKVFIKCLEERIDDIEKVEQKKELRELFSIIRYYNFVAYDDERFIKDVEALQDDIEVLEEEILKKMYDFKMINTITKDLDTDIRITKEVFKTRIANLDNVVIHTFNRDKWIEVNIFDGDIMETRIEIENSKNIEFRNKKKVKLFVK